MENSEWSELTLGEWDVFLYRELVVGLLVWIHLFGSTIIMDDMGS